MIAKVAHPSRTYPHSHPLSTKHLGAQVVSVSELDDPCPAHCPRRCRRRNVIALRRCDLVDCASRIFEPTDRSVVMPINWAELPMQAIGLLAGLTFVASLIGHSLTRNAFVGAILTVIIFVAIYIAWDFYPHGYLPNVRFPTR
jgi:hypothetical protein